MKSDESGQTPSKQDAQRKEDQLAEVLSAEQIRCLKNQWIETPEQFLSIAATDEGQVGLCKLLGIKKKLLIGILDHLRKMIPPETARDVSTPKPGGSLGVILTEDQIRKHSHPQEGEGE